MRGWQGGLVVRNVRGHQQALLRLHNNCTLINHKWQPRMHACKHVGTMTCRLSVPRVCWRTIEPDPQQHAPPPRTLRSLHS